MILFCHLQHVNSIPAALEKTNLAEPAALDVGMTELMGTIVVGVEIVGAIVTNAVGPTVVAYQAVTAVSDQEEEQVE